MIVPMKKVMVAMLDSERVQGLTALRKLGMVHPEPLSGAGKDLDEIRAQKALLERCINILGALKAPRKSAEGQGGAVPEALEAAKRIEELAAREKANLDRMAGLTREMDRLITLGDFDPDSIRFLQVPGRKARIHALNRKDKTSFPEGVEAVFLGSEKGRDYYLSLSPEAMEEDALPDSILLPEKGRSAMLEEISLIQADNRRIAMERVSLTACLPVLKEELAARSHALRFENLRSGMASQGPIAYLTGWAPATEVPLLGAEASKRGWAFAEEDPADDEMPPTKVRNNPLVRIIQPIFDFLGTVPSYREYEISAWFLLFFCIFYAMIFGDGGYGSLMLVGSVALGISSLVKRKTVPDGIWLFLLLSAFTVAWGVMTGSWFGLPRESLPKALTVLAVPQIASWNPKSGDNIKIICFVLGLIQLSIAHAKNIVRDLKARSLKFLAQIGSLALVTGMFWLVLNLVIDPERFPIPNYSLYLVGGGFLLVFVFSNYERNLGQSIVDGLKGIIPTFLGTVSVFADIVSYIRLWAVGLAGVAISQTVNGMAGDMLKGFSALSMAGILILAFGHGLNLLMSVLSVIVHGVRLNMLEFSGHLGMEWSGYKYEPFREPEGRGPDGKEQV